MDFYQIKTLNTKKGVEIYPDFKISRSNDLMVRGRSFYALWNEDRNIWSTDEEDLPRIVDQELDKFKDLYLEQHPDSVVYVKYMRMFGSKMWQNYRAYLREMFDTNHQLDEKITFLNTERRKFDYTSKRLSYPLEEGSYAAYDELVSTLYTDEERAKLEWAIGAVISGDARTIQKFIVLYGEAGAGKSTILNIIQKLFDGYYTAFEAKALASSNNAFSTEVFRSNPLVAIQHDGDLSKIEDNTKLNSIISHEEMIMNEKYKASYMSKLNAFLFMATNKPVKITDAKSGIIRRLIDVRPSGSRIPSARYYALMSQIDFELGAIAWHCLEVYRTMGKNYYSAYRPIDMMYQTDFFFNFVEEYYYVFSKQDGVTLLQAFEMYKTYCEESSTDFRLPKHKFREELKSYFERFYDNTRINGVQVRNYYRGFLIDKFSSKEPVIDTSIPCSLVLDERSSDLDILLADCPAQYATNDIPEKKWAGVKTVLSDLNTQEVHFVRPPLNHIVIDFDLKDDSGNKSMELNLEAASKWPTTYTEFSKSGAGVHLHYIYDGDVERLSRVYSDGIEIKVFVGQSSLRRKLTRCNNSPIAIISSGLPLKGEKMIDFNAVQSEKGLRDLIARNLKKEIHPGTKPSIDFIHKILEDAYNSGMKYDVTDLRPKVLAFANNSTHQADYCIKLVQKMAWASEEPSETPATYQNEELVFFDVEVFPNLFVVCWKTEIKDVVGMINPTPKEIEELLKLKLVGFNNRRYDNHILYAAYIGYTNEQLYNLSQKLVSGGNRNCFFGEAYNLSYTDVYDFSSVKQGLKKFQIELGIHHLELGLPWDQPVSEELWPKVVEYCGNDVTSLQDVFESRKQDFIARLILSDLSGLSPNDTTQQHTAKIMFGNDKKPQDKFIYTDLSEMFPGYLFDGGKSTYRGEEASEGGYVYAEPGMYTDVAVLDIVSMHPTSLVEMNMFGPYTARFKELLDARVAIKHKDYDAARQMLGGILNNYLTGDGDSGALAYALKIVINIVYGLTSAKFENKFKDPRNKDNIVAKRGALFMIDLKHAVQEQGYTVAHIKTDSIKIPNATEEIIAFVMEFGEKYGYTFEHEETYQKMCLVNDAVYIAKTQNDEWTATGTQFAQPYVFKTLFSHEPIVFDDMVETKTVTSALYLDMNEANPEEHDYHFIGKAGAFCPILSGCGGGLLCRIKDDNYHAATGSKGYRWLEAEMVKMNGKENDIDRGYYNSLVDDAVENISKYGDFEWFISDCNEMIDSMVPPWLAPCGKDVDCVTCAQFDKCEDTPF